jgi:hypothetical protein
MNGKTQRWQALLQDMFANNRLTDRESRKIRDAVESVDHAGVLRQLALDMAESVGRRSAPGATSPFLQPDLPKAFSQASHKSERLPQEVAPTEGHPIQRIQRATEQTRQSNHAGARDTGLPSDQAAAPAHARPMLRPSRPS